MLTSLTSDQGFVVKLGRFVSVTMAGGQGELRMCCGCAQYDVDLVQNIERLIGHQLEEFTLEEAQVLKGITRVYSAKREVAVKALEDESRDDKHRQLIKRKSGHQKAKRSQAAAASSP